MATAVYDTRRARPRVRLDAERPRLPKFAQMTEPSLAPANQESRLVDLYVSFTNATAFIARAVNVLT